MLRATLKRISIVLALVGALIASGGVAYAKTCTAFGCSPAQGNPINELGGMIVTGGVVAVVLFGFARRYVK